MKKSYTATMSLILEALLPHGLERPIYTAKGLYGAYVEIARLHKFPQVSLRTVHRNLGSLIELGWVESDQPPGSIGRRYQATVTGASARLRFGYGEMITIGKLDHDHSYGRQCVKCSLLS
jgi:Fe2+ or Zn2+ uptake regulation protein